MKGLRLVAVTALTFLVGAPVAAAGLLHPGDAPAPFTLPRSTGGTLASTSLRGKPVYINFFATWCGPCNEEAPSIVQLWNKYRSKGLVTVGIDELENLQKAKSFAAKFKIAFPVVTDDNGATGKNYGALGLPVHVFVDRNGKVSTYRLGEMKPDEIEAAIKKIVG